MSSKQPRTSSCKCTGTAATVAMVINDWGKVGISAPRLQEKGGSLQVSRKHRDWKYQQQC